MTTLISPNNLEPWPQEYDELFSAIHHKKITFDNQIDSINQENYEHIEEVINKEEKSVCWGPFGFIVISLFIIAFAIIIQNKLEQERPRKYHIYILYYVVRNELI